MKRTTKRRLGMAGLVTAGMMLVMFVVSTKFGLFLSCYPSRSLFSSRPMGGIGLAPGAFGVSIPHGFWEMNRSWSLDARAHPEWSFFYWRPKLFADRRRHILLIPLWIPTLIIAIPSFILWRRNRKLPESHCDCGYNLTGNLSGVCPECGRKLDCGES